MSGVMETGMDRGKDSALERGEASPAGRRETRWSARRKEEVVLRLLRGESLDLLARETGHPASAPTTDRSGCWPRSAGASPCSITPADRRSSPRCRSRSSRGMPSTHSR